MSENQPAFKILVVSILSLFLLGSFYAVVPAADDTTAKVAGLSKEEALKLGEIMYREGILPSGGPMEALVQGDIPVDSTMFSCVSCHLRSGLGSLEGRVVTYPIDGITLYKPLTNSWNMRWVSGSRYARSVTGDLRPAYNDETLAAAIRGGLSPNGKMLDYVMPRYPLNDRDMEILIFYLRNLSVKPSPGATDTTIALATIITDDVSQADREAMMGPLKVMVGASKSGRLSRMAKLALASDPDSLMNKGYVTLSMAYWELKGPREGWGSQLEAYYKNGPVFAVVGGGSNGDWSPVHKFCEENRIPCLLPLTDLPAISTTDWYTLYFSKGLYQEGEAAAKYLNGSADISQDAPVIQVYRNSEKGRAMAKGFEDAWVGVNRKKPETRMLTSEETLTAEFWKQFAALHKQAVIILWLSPQDLSSIAALAETPDKPKMIFLSSSLLGKQMYDLPEKIRKIVYMTYPYRLPEDFNRYQPSPSGLQKSIKSPADYSLIQAKTNFNVMIITKSIFMLKGFLNRDRFLEVVDMMQDETMVPLYPRLSFGPGQRSISKGCYIVQLTDGPAPKLIGVSDWVIP
jgi:hypothetical protein